MCRELCFPSSSPVYLHPFLGRVYVTWNPFLLSWTLHPGDTWLFSATVLGSRHVLCGLEAVMYVLICPEVHRCFGQAFAIVFPPSPLKVPCISSGSPC